MRSLLVLLPLLVSSCSGQGAGQALLPDLAVVRYDAAGLAGWPASAGVNGVLRVRVANLGKAASTQAAPLLVFEDRDRDGRYSASADALLGSAQAPALGRGETAVVEVNLRGSLLFAGNRMHVAIDPGGSQREARRDNNILVVQPSTRAASIEFERELKQRWARVAFGAFPESRFAASTPLVSDLDGDGAIEVVLATYAGQNGARSTDGVLRVLRGRDGGEVWATAGPQGTHLQAFASPAAADLDLDGRLEIVALLGDNHLAAFTATGALLWRSAAPAAEGDAVWGAVTAADLDGDGYVEVIYGAAVFGYDGALKWRAKGCTGGHPGAGPASFALDADLDGKLEVFAGCALYRWDGTLYKKLPVDDGFPAAANFDSDPSPEFVVVSQGTVTLVDDSGYALWQRAIPGGGWGGAPVLADVDLDGRPEIGVAGATRFAVFSADGELRWQAAIEDPSAVSGATAFDFTGAGGADFVVGDERALRVLRGRDGFQLALWTRSSITALEVPVVADVDGDGRADLLTTGTGAALTVAGGENWRGAGQWANAAGWSGGAWWLDPAANGFRLQASLARPAARLTLGGLRYEAGALSVRLGNGGDAAAGAAVAVSFYRGEPGAGNPPLGTVMAGAGLEAGAFVDVRLAWAGPLTAASSLTAMAGAGLRTSAEMTAPAFPAVVEDLTARAVAGAVRLEWTPPAGAVAQRVYRSVAGESAELLQTAAAGARSWEDRSAPAALVSTYSVRWVDGAGVESEDGMRVGLAPGAGVGFAGAPVWTASAGQAWSYVVRTTPANLPLALERAPAGMTVDAAGVLRWTPSQTGSFEVRLRAVYSSSIVATQSFRVRVGARAANRAPVFVSGAAGVAPAGALFSFEVKAADPDGDALLYALERGPSGMSLGAASGLLRWTPAETQIGAHEVRIRASDPAGLFTVQSFTLSATRPNRAPVITSTPPQAVRVGRVYTYKVVTEDPDAGESLSFSFSQAPAYASIHPASGLVQWVPREAGVETFSVQVADSGGLRAAQTWVVDAVPASGAPVITSAPVRKARIGVAYGYDVNAEPAVDGEPLYYFLDQAPAGMGIHTGSGFIGWTPAAAQRGAHVVVARVQDKAGRTATQVFTVTAETASEPALEARLIGPAPGARLASDAIVLATAAGGAGFKRWTLAYQSWGALAWTVLASGAGPLREAPLAVFPATLLANNAYRLRLSAEDSAGSKSDEIELIVDTGAYKPGAARLAFDDLRLPGGAFDLLGRVYDAGAPQSSDFGPGWSLAASRIDLRLDARGNVYVSPPGGPRMVFAFQPVSISMPWALVFNNRYTARGAPHASLENVDCAQLILGADGFLCPDLAAYRPQRFLLTTADSARYWLSVERGLERVERPSAEPVEFSAAGARTQSGVEVRIARDSSGRIASITAPDGLATRFGYDAEGRLAAVTDEAGGTAQILYDGATHRLREIRTAQGCTPVWFEYDADGRLASSTDARGGRTRQFYNPAARSVETLDPTGGRQVERFDERGRVVERIDAAGGRSTFRWDEEGRLLGALDAAGLERAWTYDAAGRVIESREAGAARRYVYDDGGRLVSVIHADLSGEYWTYDANGNVLRWEIRDRDAALLTRRTWTYDAAARVESIRDGTAARSWLDYDPHGRLSAWRHDSGARVDFRYDAAGLLSERQPLGGAATRYAYDNLRRLTAAGATAYTYTQDGSLRSWIGETGQASQVDVNCGGDLLRAEIWGSGVTHFVVDAAGRHTSIERPGGVAVRREYDSAGRLTKETAGPRRVEWSYDAAGRPAALIHENESRREQWRWTWSAAGEPLSLTRGDGQGLQWEWDERRRLAALRVGAADPISYRWDGAGRLVSARAGGHEVRLEYDLAGQLIRQTASNGTASGFDYDHAGRLAAARVRREGVEVLAAEWSYDAEGRLREPIGAAQAGPATAVVAGLETDWLGRRVRETVNGVRREVWWDGERLVGVGGDVYVTHPVTGAPLFALLNGRPAFYVLDPLGNVIALLDDGGAVGRRYSYDAAGRPLEPYDPADPNRLRWRGRLFDPWSGVSWFGARAWDPASARFLTPAPAEEVYAEVVEGLRAVQPALPTALACCAQ